MKAMVLHKLYSLDKHPMPLVLEEWPVPEPRPGQVLIEVAACGVCHTELDEIEGRTPPTFFPIILGHQIVGIVRKVGEGVSPNWIGQRVGVGWIGSTCGSCKYCREHRENLCPQFLATGRDLHGGYAEYAVAHADYVFSIPEAFSDVEAAPLLCAGAIGYRSLFLTGLKDGEILGLTGFGASGHIVLQLAKALYPHSPVFVFARSETERGLARELGAQWTGDIGELPPELPHRIIDTTPVWSPVLASLRVLAPGGRLVINAIRKENKDLSQWLSLDYARDLWMEKEVCSVANVTRADITEFLPLAAQIDIRPYLQTFPLDKANEALRELRERKIRGAKVLVMK